MGVPPDKSKLLHYSLDRSQTAAPAAATTAKATTIFDVGCLLKFSAWFAADCARDTLESTLEIADSPFSRRSMIPPDG